MKERVVKNWKTTLIGMVFAALSVVNGMKGAPIRDQKVWVPALIAAIRDTDGALTGVEVTYLAANGQRAVDLRLARKTVGLVPGGCAVRLDPAAPEMLVAEGVFTALSASEWFGLPAWALMSTRNLRAWTPPASPSN